MELLALGTETSSFLTGSWEWEWAFDRVVAERRH